MAEKQPQFIKPPEEGFLVDYFEYPGKDVIERYERDLRKISKELVDEGRLDPRDLDPVPGPEIG